LFYLVILLIANALWTHQEPRKCVQWPHNPFLGSIWQNPCTPLAEPLGSAEPWLKNTGLERLLRNDLLCVEWDVKLYLITHSLLGLKCYFCVCYYRRWWRWEAGWRARRRRGR